MDMSREEQNRRRALRDKRRQELRKRRNRQWFSVLGVAAVLLIGIGIIAFSMLHLQQEEPGQTGPSQQATQPGAQAPEGEKTVITITAGGDVNVTDKVIAAGRTELGYDFSGIFMDVLPALADSDLTILNFEGIQHGSTYGSGTAAAPKELLQALDQAGVDMLQTANSCSISGGVAGLKQTIISVLESGMEPVGTFADTASFKDSGGFTFWEINGVRVAVVAFTKGMNGMGLPEGSEDCVNLLYTDYHGTYQTVDTAGITKILKNVRKAKPDITIALLHWGSEYNDQISTTQNNIRTLLQENGVDVILGTHSHHVQQIIHDPETGAFTAYSLGDFLGDGSRGGTQYSVLLKLQITKDHTTGVTKVTSYDYTPLYLLDETAAGGSLRLLRIREAMNAYENGFVGSVSREVYEKMQSALKLAENRMKG